MRRIAVACTVVLLTAACSNGGHAQAPRTSSPAAATPSPAATLLPADVLTSLGAIGDDTKKISHDSGGDVEAADCRALGKDASSASVETLPVAAWQVQWRKVAAELQKAADECSSAQSTGDQATMQQALTDLTAASDDLATFNQMSG